jgi:hypothetical protein
MLGILTETLNWDPFKLRVPGLHPLKPLPWQFHCGHVSKNTRQDLQDQRECKMKEDKFGGHVLNYELLKFVIIKKNLHYVMGGIYIFLKCS